MGSTFAAATGRSELDYLVLLPPEQLCVERVAPRTGHGFTDEAATRKMHAEFRGAAVDPRDVVSGPWTDVDALVEIIRDAQAAETPRFAVRGEDQ